MGELKVAFLFFSIGVAACAYSMATKGKPIKIAGWIGLFMFLMSGLLYVDVTNKLQEKVAKPISKKDGESAFPNKAIYQKLASIKIESYSTPKFPKYFVLVEDKDQKQIAMILDEDPPPCFQTVWFGNGDTNKNSLVVLPFGEKVRNEK